MKNLQPSCIQRIMVSSASASAPELISATTFLFLACLSINQQYAGVGAFVYTPADIPVLNISSSLSEQEALDRLLHRARYDPRSGPPSDGTSEDIPVIISIGILLLVVASPDESSLKYEIDFLLNMAWTDNRLRYRIIEDEEEAHKRQRPWTREQFVEEKKYSIYNYAALPLKYEEKKGFLDGLHHSDVMWMPDIYFVKHGEFRQHIEPKHLALRIFPTGRIAFTTRKYLILSCSGEPPVFPFDVANCSFSLESVVHEQDFLDFQWLNNSTHLRASDSLRRVNTYFVSNKTGYCPHQSAHGRGDYSCLQVEMIFSRDRAYYFTTVFIPGIILVTSSFITFWLEWNAVAARIMLGVTTMLNFFITSNRFRVTLPVVSELHAMNIWEGFSMTFIYSALLEFIVVNYVGRKRPRVLEKSAESKGIEADSPDVNNENNENLDTQQETGEPERKSPGPNLLNINIQVLQERMFQDPIKTAKTIDIVSRIVFPVAYLIVLIVFFVKFLGLLN